MLQLTRSAVLREGCGSKAWAWDSTAVGQAACCMATPLTSPSSPCRSSNLGSPKNVWEATSHEVSNDMVWAHM